METFLAVLGATATIAAVVGAGSGLLRWWRNRRARAELARLLFRLSRVERRLRAWAVAVDARLADGVDWAGVDVWPGRLAGHLVYLNGNIEDLDDNLADVRSVDARDSTERLRQDIQRLTEVLIEAAELYLDGTLATYRASEGRPVPPSAGGREPCAALADEVSAERMEQLRREATMLFRTSRRRLALDPAGSGYVVHWPVRRWEVDTSAGRDLWGNEPRPLDH